MGKKEETTAAASTNNETRGGATNRTSTEGLDLEDQIRELKHEMNERRTREADTAQILDHLTQGLAKLSSYAEGVFTGVSQRLDTIEGLISTESSGEELRVAHKALKQRVSHLETLVQTLRDRNP